MGSMTRAQAVATAAGTLTLSMIGIGLAPGAVGAGATTVSQTHASSTFLSGTLGSLPEGAVATNDGGVRDVTTHKPLLATPVNALLRAGVANQIAFAGTDGVARALTGAVDDGDGVAPADLTLSLDSVVGGTPLERVLENLTVTLGALSSAAAVDATQTKAIGSTCADSSRPVHCRDYDIAGGSLTFKSPLVGDLVTQVLGSLKPVTDAVNGLSGPDGRLARELQGLSAITQPLGVADLDITAKVTLDDLDQAVRDALRDPLSDGVVSIDLTTGEISVDLDELVTAATGKALNNQAPNTEVLSKAVIDALTGRLAALLGTVPGKVLDVVTTAVNAAKVDISANVCVVGIGTAPDCRIEVPLLPSTPGSGIALKISGTIAELLDDGGSATLDLRVLGIPVPTVDVDDVLGQITPLLRAVTDTVDNDLAGALAPIISGVTSGLAPALDALPQLLSLKVNVQERGDLEGLRSYVQSAVAISVAGGRVLDVDIARSEVSARLDSRPATDPAPSVDPDAGAPAGDPDTGPDNGTDPDPRPDDRPLPDVPTRFTAGL